MEGDGLAIPLDVLTAQDALLNSLLQFASESFNRTILQLDLLRSIGDLDPTSPGNLRWSQPAAAPSGQAL
jgi:outer membrane protein TolC